MTKKNFGMGSSSAKLWRLGSSLLAEDQALALEVWEGQRYTETEEAPDWVRREGARGRQYPPQFKSSQDWLEHTKFAVTMNMRLDRRSRECREAPTWPTRPDLQGASLAAQAFEAPNLRSHGWAREYETEQVLARSRAESEAAGKTAEQIIIEAMAERDRRIAAGLPPDPDDE
jgi:hypothetical protein